MNKAIVDETLVGKRLDEALPLLGFVPSRSKGSILLKEGKVLVNGKKEKAHYPLELGDEITAEEYEAPKSKLDAQDIPLEKIYEDDDVLIINKPAGLLVHPGAGHHDGTLANALAFMDENLPSHNGENRPGLVHRIDKDTSGLLAIAKSERAFTSLSAQLADHSMHREYYALVLGIIPEDDGKIIAPIGRDKKHPLRNCVDLKAGKEATTFFHVEKRFKSSGVTLISCRLLTGRTHQIRVHMEYIGHPVIGDQVYGAGNRKLYDEGQLLHAYQLTFKHPKDGKEVTFKAPLPEHFEKVLSSLK